MRGFKISLFCILVASVLLVHRTVQRTDTGPPGMVETVMQNDVLIDQPVVAFTATHFTCHRDAAVQRTGVSDIDIGIDPSFYTITEKRKNPDKTTKYSRGERTPYLYWRDNLLRNTKYNRSPIIQLRT